MNKTNHSLSEPCLTGSTSKIDLKDVTFVVPLRIDSTERKENIDTLLKHTFNHFNTNFIVLEADSERQYFPAVKPKGFNYEFLYDKNEIFHRTNLINKLISLSLTPIVAVWDSDAIAPPNQILDSVKKIRSGEAVMSLPYDGRFYSCDKISCTLFKKYLDIQILLKRLPVMLVMHGSHSVGGAYIVDKEKYQNLGGENENFYGWGPEDAERVKRIEIFGLIIHNSFGQLFHMLHPIMKNSWFASKEIERKNRQEFLNTCKRKDL